MHRSSVLVNLSRAVQRTLLHATPDGRILMPQKENFSRCDAMRLRATPRRTAQRRPCARRLSTPPIKNLPAGLRGKRPKGAEHSPWEILEHLRIAQWDILEFSRNPDTRSPTGPSGYWPATAAPPDDKAWDKSVRAFRQRSEGDVRPGRQTRRPICTRRFRTATGRPSCARRCWWPITMPIISANWCWCAGCWARGEDAGSRDQRNSGQARQHSEPIGQATNCTASCC